MADGMTFNEIQAELTRRVWNNDALRSELEKDTKGVIERELNIKLDDKSDYKVIDQASETIYFVLPKHPKSQHHVDFSDEQLDAVAGGGILTTALMATVATIIPIITLPIGLQKGDVAQSAE